MSSFLEEKRAIKIAVFGSFSTTTNLLILVKIKRKLSNFLGIKIYLLTEASISSDLIARIPYLVHSDKKINKHQLI